ncbi:MAG TPA: hypothetical protein VKP69_35005, partial [Isosphaeraceae bacterium]|nr:hypothetical protein [Isosphaeraceae bacterium]
QRAIEQLLDGRRFEFDVERAIFLTVLHRLFDPGSDRAADTWRTDYPMFGVARAFPRGRAPESAVFSGGFSTGSLFQPEKRSDNISHSILEFPGFSP